MNYNKPELLNSLAAEYVLGTLTGLARKRFQRLMLVSNKAREATNIWEQNLNNLASAISPQTPSDSTWHEIMRRIENKPQLEKSQLIIKPSIWRAWSFLATAACIILAVLVTQATTNSKQTQQIALVKNQTEQPLWFINVSNHELSIKASNQLIARTDRDYELWMILKGQDTPVSLGLLPKNGDKTILKSKLFKATDITLLAVSLEPVGGSPNGLPTEVLYTTELVLL